MLTQHPSSESSYQEIEPSSLIWPPIGHDNDDGWQLYVRAYGLKAIDLDIDFTSSPSLMNATRLICACSSNAAGHLFSEKEVMSWTLAKRLQGLIAIFSATAGYHLNYETACSNEACRQVIAFELNLADMALETLPEQVVCQADADTTLTMRLPTGDDQASWFSSSQDRLLPDDQLINHMAQSLIVKVNNQPAEEGLEVKQAWITPISQALELADPFNAFDVSLECPHCSENIDISVDLEATILKQMESLQKTLIDEIHVLASHYHWPESQILALSPKRRAHYLKRLQKDEWPV